MMLNIVYHVNINQSSLNSLPRRSCCGILVILPISGKDSLLMMVRSRFQYESPDNEIWLFIVLSVVRWSQKDRVMFTWHTRLFTTMLPCILACPYFPSWVGIFLLGNHGQCTLTVPPEWMDEKNSPRVSAFFLSH